MTTASAARRGSASAGRISRRPPGKRSVVTQHQARHFVQLVRLLEREFRGSDKFILQVDSEAAVLMTETDPHGARVAARRKRGDTTRVPPCVSGTWNAR